MSYDGTVKFIYTCKETQPYRGVDSSFPELLPDETVTIEIPCYDLNIHQYFHAFKKFLGAVGFCEKVILDGAFHVAFNDSNTKEVVDKLMREYEVQDKQYYTTEDYENLDAEKRKLEAQVRDLKAKLSRCKNKDNSQYTDEEIEAMMWDNGYFKGELNEWNGLVPGSTEAIQLGCTCPYLDNLEMPDDKKWVDVNCPIHGRKVK
jgi:hypothetical protein